MRILYTQQDIDNGLIILDSEIGKELGFTSDRFQENSFLWLEDNKLFLSLIFSKEEHKGYVLNLLNKAKEKGYNMCACTVSERMDNILKKFGFERSCEGDLVYINKAKAKEC